MAKPPSLYDTIPALFFANATRFGKRQPIWLHKSKGRYQPISWSEAAEWVTACASAMLVSGIRLGDRIAILSENRPEWAVTDLAALTCGAVSVPIYATDTAAEISYILRDSGATFLFLSSETQLRKLDAVRETLNHPLQVITFDSLMGRAADASFYDAWLREGRRHADAQQTELASRLARLTSDDPATIIYTSGTSGTPKGVILTHRNFLTNCASVAQVVPIDEHDIHLSVLPLSHVFERMAGYYLMMQQGATVAYAESLEQVAQNICEVRPTVMCAVPRLYEKIYARILEARHEGPAPKRFMARWLVGAAQQLSKSMVENRAIPTALRIGGAVARRVLGAKLRKQLGGRLRFFVSGGAPLSLEIAAFFEAMGVIILEGYGLTETSPVITVNTLTARKLGTVGRPIPGVEVRIMPDGEIETKGPHVMRGYFNNPAATAEILRDGWLATGDIGHLDIDGFLSITDRKKDLIITAGGKNVAPQKLENLLKADPLINQVFVYGDRRPYLVALVVPHFERLAEEARRKNIPCEPRPQLVRHPAMQQLVTERVHRLCEHLATYEQIKYCALLDREFTREEEEMTPTLKLRRKVIGDKYQSLIESMYAQPSSRQ